MNFRSDNSVFHALQGIARSVERFTTEPFCADLFAWCAMTGTDARLKSRLQLSNVPFSSLTPVSLLKARLERRIAVDKNHWSYDWNRIIALKQALETVEKYEGAQ